jgi:hypothetical protein
MANIDLNAARRARAEKQAEPKTVTFGDPEQTVELPQEASFEFAEALQAGDVRQAITLVLNGHAEAFFAATPSLDDVKTFLEGLGDMYAGLEAGESPASGSSSKRGTKSSRQPSRGSTASS